MLSAFAHHMQTNEVLAHTFFKSLNYNVRTLFNNAVGGHTLSKTSEDLFDLLDMLSKGEQGHDREMLRTRTQ